MRKIALSIVAASSILVFASGCSSSGSSSGSSQSAAGSSSPAASGKTPYVIGQVGTFSGPNGSSQIGAKYGLDAWVKWTNAHGGINGHPVQLISLDDQQNAATLLTETKKLVQQDHVIALVGTASSVEPAMGPYIASGSVPLIGGDLSFTDFGQYQNFYPEGTTQDALYNWAPPASAALEKEAKYGAIYCVESSQCKQIVDAQKADAGSAGVSFVFSSGASASASSYTAQCLAAKSAGANAVGLFLAEVTVVQVISSCQQQGYNPLWLTGGTGMTASEASATSGTVVGPVPTFPWFAASNPAEQAFQTAMHQYEAEVFTAAPSSLASSGYGGAAVEAWVAGEIFAAAASNVPSGTAVTGAAIEAQLAQLPKGDTFGGSTVPLTYSGPDTKQPAVNCFYLLELRDHKYSVLDNGAPICRS